MEWTHYRTLLNMLVICAKDHPFDWEHRLHSLQQQCSVLYGVNSILPYVWSSGKTDCMQTAFDLVKIHVIKAPVPKGMLRSETTWEIL